MNAVKTNRKNSPKVRLLRFGEHQDVRQPRPPPHLPSLSITVNGGRLGRSAVPSVVSTQQQPVKLVRFGPHGADAVLMNGSKDSDDREASTSPERRERLARLMRETQEWFAQVRQENHRWRASGVGDPADGGRSDLTGTEEDVFAQFVRDNQERFAQLLESSGMCSLFTQTTPPRPASMTSFVRHSDGLFANGLGRALSRDASRLEEEPQKRATRPPPFPTAFSSFPTSMVSPISPTKLHSCQHGKSGGSCYHMMTSRSTFEYCGNTNTYRFCTEQMMQTMEQGYESISESEDEEEESLEDATSTMGDPSESDETSTHDSSLRSDSGCMLAIEYEAKKDKVEKAQQILYKIAMEILTTERTYVSILHLLDQIFSFRVDQENRAHPMFPQEVVTQMFCNLKSLYKLHHDFLLPQLEERMQNWDTDPRIGDVMKNFAPFLKMYTEYVKNYDNAMSLINLWYNKQSRFAQIMDDIHRMDICSHLTLQHHMLTPVQRVPRYQLLLKDYLKKLPDDSPDRADTEKALELVSTAAHHANEAMKKIDKFKKLLEVQEMIGGVVDLVSPTRELMKEGKIIKISARSGDHQERYLFLFNDLLLLCSQRLIANRVVSGPLFRVRARLEVEGLVIEEGDNLETANTFYIRNNGRSIELYTQTPEEKAEWMEVLATAVRDLVRRKSSLRVSDHGLTPSPDNLDLGGRAPTFIRQDTITHCMVCKSQFGAFSFKRKHHCHACGIVACSKCLSQKASLAYDGNRCGRVCGRCHTAIAQSSPDQIDGSPPDLESPIKRRGILEVRPTDPAVVSGYLQLKARSKTWLRRWFSLHSDFVLYSFRSHEEDRAMTSMPVPGYTVSLPEKGDNVDGRESVFKLFHKKKVYFFQTANSTELHRWISGLEKASRAELAS